MCIHCINREAAKNVIREMSDNPQMSRNHWLK